MFKLHQSIVVQNKFITEYKETRNSEASQRIAAGKTGTHLGVTFTIEICFTSQSS